MFEFAPLEKLKTRILVGLLQGVAGGYLAEPVFQEMLRINCLPAYEVVPIVNGEAVAMYRRPHSDPVWPGQFHTPGTILRATDDNVSIKRRVLEDEMGLPETLEPTFAGNMFNTCMRGTNLCMVHWLSLNEQPKGSKLIKLSDVNEVIIPDQIGIADLAINHYLKSK